MKLKLEITTNADLLNQLLKQQQISKQISDILNITDLNIEFDKELYGTPQFIIKGNYIKQIKVFNHSLIYKKLPIKIRLEPKIYHSQIKFNICKVVVDKLPIEALIKLTSQLKELIYESDIITLILKNNLYLDSPIFKILVPYNLILTDDILTLQFKNGGYNG